MNDNAKINDIMKGLSLAQSKSFIDATDFTAVINRLIHVDGWSNKSALAATQQYRNFLYLKKKHGNKHPLPPSYEMDEVWHAHILHTESYADFCNTLFGGFLHHQPTDLKEKNSTPTLSSLFEETQALYHAEFNDYIYHIKKSSCRWVITGFLRKIALFLKKLFPIVPKTSMMQ